MNLFESFTPSKILNHAKKWIEDARPIAPKKSLFSQGERFADFLLAEDSFEWNYAGSSETFTMFTLKDGALGVALSVSLIEHETLSERDISDKLETLAETISKLKDPNISLQFIFDSVPDRQSESPWIECEKSFATKIAQERFEFISKFASKTKHGMRLTQRSLVIAIRLSGTGLFPKGKGFSGNELEVAEKHFLSRISALREALVHVKSGLNSALLSHSIFEREDFVRFLRRTVHSSKFCSEAQTRIEKFSQKNAALREQILLDCVHMTPQGIGLGTGKNAETWQVASLLELPETTHFASLAKLLSITLPHRIVVNVRPVVKTSDLDSKRYLLKNAEDAFGTKQFEDITAAQVRTNQEESLSAFSLHFFLKNETTSLEDLEEKGLLRTTLSEISAKLGCQFIEESLCAPLVFACCLPFQNSTELCVLVGREMRVLAKNLVGLLPMYCGFKGTKSPMVQMISRGGERIHLNPRDSQGASHVAVLGGSGAGKSFSIANLIVSFMATFPKGRVFVIDKKTSYAALAWLSAEEKYFGGSSFFNPPQNFPNIFSGVCTRKNDGLEITMDEDRLPAIVNLLLTAISLLSPKSDLGATHTRVLSDAVKLTCEEKARHASTRFDSESGETVSAISDHVALPKLSEVLSNLPAACDSLQFSQTIASELKEYLSPFVGSGPYAKFFDVGGFETSNERTPLITLCDLDGVSSDPVLLVLTVQAMVLEILRLVKPKQDGTPNPPSLLVIEEVGVLASESPALVAFIRDAWKTMRKFGVTCVGATNEVSDFTEKPGPKEIWNVSPNKILLKQTSSAISEMESLIAEGRNGLVPSVYHCDVLRSLKMEKGNYADAFWLGDTAQGTFSYMPTGFDYWCAASDPTELSTLKILAEEIGKFYPNRTENMFCALEILAKKYPSGVREKSELRSLSADELLELVASVSTSDCEEGKSCV